MKKFFLIGIPNCGKSTLGKRAADTLGLPFYDVDIIAQQRTGFNRISDLFNSSLMNSFFRANMDIIEESAALDTSAIIATGAETPLIAYCAEIMRESGVIIHIQKSPEVILEEMRRDGTSGFILENQKTGKQIAMSEKAVTLYSEELPTYESLADVTLVNDGNEEVGSRKLISIIERESKNFASEDL
jgi:shikimate kinase